MFYLIRKTLAKALSLNKLTSRICELEEKVKKFESLAAENEALWRFLDGQDEPAHLIAEGAEDFEDAFPDAIVRNMKPYGEA
jgi:hypothetical protein